MKRVRPKIPIDEYRDWRDGADLAFGVLMAVALIVGLVLLVLGYGN